MELTLAQLQEITLGALRFEETVDGFRFYRLTPSQTAAFTRANETFEGKCYAAAGIRLDFETDSDRRIHPNDAGFVLYGQRLIELLEQTQSK